MLSSVAISRAEIEAFLFTEARLADSGDYDAWLSLWTDDALYWIPANRDDYDPNAHVSIIYADRERLQDRIDRLKSGGAWAQEPMSRACRLISNVEVESPDKNDEITVRSNFVLGELRRGRQTIYFAHQIHRLRPTATGLRMSYKKVMLINNDEPIHNLSFLV